MHRRSRRGEGGDHHNDRQADTDTGQGETSASRDMSNVDPVNDVVQHVDDLCDDRWNGKLKEEFSDRLCPKKFFTVVHAVFLLSCNLRCLN